MTLKFGSPLLPSGNQSAVEAEVAAYVAAYVSNNGLIGNGANPVLLNGVFSPAAADRYPLNLNGQEQSVFYQNGQYYNLYTNGGGGISFTYCATDPTIATNWASPVQVLGNNTGGEASTAKHGYAYLENNTIYMYYINPTGIAVATAPIPAAATTPTFTKVGLIFTGIPSGGSQNGNCCVIKVAPGKYYLYQESLWQNSFATEGTTNSWQIGLLQCSTPTGTFTPVPSPLYQNGLGTITGGSSYTNGTYNNVPLTGGTGSGAQATVVVAGNVVTTVTLTANGTGYLVGDTLSAAAANIGGTGSGFSVGPTTVVNCQQTTLRPGPNASASGGNIALIGNTYVIYYHGGTWGRIFPNDIYRATIPAAQIGTDNWTISQPGAGSSTIPINPAILKRAHYYEFDQIADASFCAGPNGVSYMFYTGCNNRAGVYQLMMTPFLPPPTQLDGTFSHIVLGSSFASPPYWNPDDSWAWQLAGPNLISNAAKKQGTWGLVTAASQYTGVLAENTSATSGDYIEFDVTLSPGTYSINVLYATGPGNGIFSLYLYDGYLLAPSAVTIDSYAASGANNVSTNVTYHVLGYETWRWRLRIACSSKNASSTGFLLSYSHVSIQRTGN